MDLYLQILLETAHTASIIPMGNDAAFFAMKAFGGYDMRPAWLIAAAGGTLGQIFNWYVGRALLLFERKGKIRIDARHYERARGLFQKYGIFLLLFCWAPMLNFVVVAAGFLNIRPRIVLPLAALGIAARYGYALLA